MHKSYSFLILVALFITQLTSCAAPVVGGPVAYADRRSAEIIYIDQKLEFKTILETQDINENDNLSFVSFNQTVLITGEVPTEEVKKEVENAVRNIEGVKEIKNYLLIGISSSLKSKASDAITTSNVVSRLFVNEYKSKLSPLHVKVVTERQEVYLMGLLNSKEVEDAIKIAKSSKGVKKVIPLFEIDDKYINSY
jgi:osmotically-inducible protein OsmY